jgi:hypothetical protein
MTAFPQEPVLRVVHPRACRGKQFYVLEQPFVYQSKAFGLITVPEGMATDFASIPRLAYTYISPESPAVLFGSVVHDYLYSILGNLPERTLIRAECDAVLREAMLECGARPTQAWLVYQAVRIGGGSHWKD